MRMFSGLMSRWTIAFVMGELQGVADLRHDGQRLLRRHAAGLDRLPQVHAVNVLHDEVEEFAATTPTPGPYPRARGSWPKS